MIRCLSACIVAAALMASHAMAEWRFAVLPTPPFTTGDDPPLSGPAVEIVQSVCRAAGVSCSFELFVHQRAFSLADASRVDGVFVMWATPEREKNYAFSTPIICTAYSLFVPAGSSLTWMGSSSLNGYTVGTGPSGVATFAAEYTFGLPGVILSQEKTTDIALIKMAYGRYGPRAAVISNREIGTYKASMLGLSLRRAADLKAIAYRVGFVADTGGAARAARFNAALAELVRAGVIQGILTRHGIGLQAATVKNDCP